ncbi:MAG: hypothetical protein EP343_32945 [Deltaproteobacteria bacterium]|nr:MAG: hypothetical protein EP343_32945 [Deltaproteobacteria bacterium]
MIIQDTDWPAVGSAKTFNYKGTDVVVVRTGQNAFSAVSNVCTHNGCKVQWAGSSLDCPCHGSSFAADGTVNNGPARNPLTKYPVEFDPSNSKILWVIF